MNFFEAEIYNTTEKFKKDKIPLPLKDLVKVEKTGVAIPGKDKYSDKTLEKLADEGINNIIEFERAYEIGNLTKDLNGDKAVLTQGIADDIHNSIENSIAFLPGVGLKLYNYLASHGIKTISQFKDAHATNSFNTEDLKNAGLNMNDVEDVQILVERKEKPGLIRVYHSSPDINCADYIFNKSWADGPNSQAYGTGLYTCWTKCSAFDDKNIKGKPNLCPKMFYRDNAISQGRAHSTDTETGEAVLFRFEFLVDATDYFISDWNLFHQIHPDAKLKDHNDTLVDVTEHNFFEYQDQRFGTNVVRTCGKGLAAAQIYFRGFDWTNHANWSRPNPHYVSENKSTGVVSEKNGPCVKGVAFIGGHDGDVVVVYNTRRALPIRVSKGSKFDWYYIGGPGTLTKAENLLSMGITTSTAAYWQQIEEEYKKTLDDIFENHQGSWDMNETEFVNSNGKNVIISDSFEDDVIEGPEANESNDNGVFDTYKLENCINAKSYHIPLRVANNLEIVNKCAARCELITSLSSNQELIVNDTLRMYNCPNANLPWTSFYSPNLTGKAKIQNMNLLPGTFIRGFDQLILAKVKVNDTIGILDCGATTSKGKIFLTDVIADDLYILIDETDELKTLKILGDSQIENLHICAKRPGKSISQIVINQNLAKTMKVHFDIQTGIHRSLYKDDDIEIKSEYSISDLDVMVKESNEGKQTLLENLQFEIKEIKMV